ncbi:MAG: SDR family NAD(P)-dependent oxidoreductase, partial [Gemmatimonadaceae bacterium]
MQISFDNRVAIVTGGANGIGLATATRLADSGAQVAIWDRVPAAGERAAAALAAAGHDVLFVVTDVTDRASVDAAVAATLVR